MTRPWKTWLVFGICCGVLLAAMGWMSFTSLRLDALQQRAAAQADLEERVRLALWRMDSWLTPMIVEENARPVSAYQSFAPVGNAYTKSLTQWQAGDVLLASPLLAYSSTNVWLHFQLDATGGVTSPQVPSASQNRQAITENATPERITLAARRLEQLRVLLDQPSSSVTQSQTGSQRDTPVSSSGKQSQKLIQSAASATNPGVQFPAQTAQVANYDVRQSEQQQSVRNSSEYNIRLGQYEQTRQLAFFNNGMIVANPLPASPALQIAGAPGLLQPTWLGDELLLARSVLTGNGKVVQGLWLNWPELKTTLLDSIRDILPHATLESGQGAKDTNESRTLAALPVRLVPGDIPVESTLHWSPVQASLGIAWGCVVLAGLAAALLLHGTLALSERRAAFVSAVTHELRTPLTTFKMYSEMLAAGMVADEEKRKDYLGTLCSEANRLNHLVENVLAYARLERGSARGRIERITLGDLVQRVKPRLIERASQAGLQVVEDVDPAAAGIAVQVDASVVEQILFNLVDNACKYAAPTATEKIIHLEAVPENGKFALLRVRDHGQGISADVARRMFQPFNKSATEAAHSAPGVGLGLALCRRLSRSMGGDLDWARPLDGGARFSLKLPVESSFAH